MSDIKELLAGLQKNYIASLPDKMAQLQKLWASKELVLLKTEYHKLKGTGKTYGLPEMSEIGAALERLCEHNSAALSRAVPLSLSLMERSRDMRTKGAVPSLSDDPEFKEIVALVEETNRKTP